jgi:hypothetical protein
MISVVLAIPGFPTDIAKLVLAPTGHMVAPLVLLNHEATLLALPVVQVILKKQHFLFVAVSIVHSQ